MGTYRKITETIGFAWERIENVWKTHVLRGNRSKSNENIVFVLEFIENERKTCVSRGNIKQNKKRCCVGTYGKRKENTCVALEYKKRTQGKFRFCVGTYGKRNENTGVA